MPFVRRCLFGTSCGRGGFFWRPANAGWLARMCTFHMGVHEFCRQLLAADNAHFASKRSRGSIFVLGAMMPHVFIHALF